MAEFPDWQNEFDATRREADSKKLGKRLQTVEAAIFLRLQALFQSSDGHVERNAIRDAMRTLRTIKTDKMHFPDWNDK